MNRSAFNGEERIGVVPVDKHQGSKYMDGLRTCMSVGGGGGGGQKEVGLRT